ncbi:MAG: LysR family transcriptional regulator [Chthoniobacterales bacterium]
MELRHLRYFIAVAEEENVTRAAARLHLSQPPLSRQIRQLEEELGVELFVRQAQSLRLTEAGRVFVSEARAVLDRADEALKSIRAFSGQFKEELHIGYAPSLTIEILPKALRHFQERFPNVQVHLHDLSTSEMLEGLREKSLQLALVVQPRKSEMKELVFKEIRSFAVCVAMHPTHALALKKRIGIRSLLDERLITYTQSQYPEYRLWLESIFKNHKRPIAEEEHNSSTSLIAAVEAGRGVAIVQDGFQCLSGPRLVVKPLATKAPLISVGIACCRATRAKKTSPEAAFWEAAMACSEI